MIHDLDVIQSFVPAEVVAVESVGVPILTPRSTSRTRACGSPTAASPTDGEPGIALKRERKLRISSPTPTSRSTTIKRTVRICRRIRRVGR